MDLGHESGWTASGVRPFDPVVGATALPARAQDESRDVRRVESCQGKRLFAVGRGECVA